MSTEPAGPRALRAVCSMATAALLGALLGEYERQSGQGIELLSTGGVDAVRRVTEGEPFDLVVLASDAIERLIGSHRLLAGSRVDLVRSRVAVAVPAGAPHPDIGSEQALRAAVLAATRIGYSTGPSGTGLLGLLQRWGIDEQVRSRMVQAKPGVPVGRLLASGEAALGFQQRSELQGIAGIELLGDLPAACAIETVFSGAICASCGNPVAAGAALSYLHAPDTAPTKRQHGMMPA
ncbi:MAG TPA: substrate-binding domain-containing protein [Steroidobacteraceae bacterium]|nr:substrate-binding domain-containing protein [Steroidobacteraceae bacterium]